MPSGAHTPCLAKRKKMRGVVALGVVPAEAVERNQHEIMLALRPGGVGAVVDVRQRQCGIEAGSLPSSRERRCESPEGEKKRSEKIDGAEREIASEKTPESGVIASIRLDVDLSAAGDQRRDYV